MYEEEFPFTMYTDNRSSTRGRSPEATLRPLKQKLLLANKILESEKLATPFGHVSVRIPGTETFLITRSVSPGAATLNDILICDKKGKILQGKYKDTYSEVVIHTGVYKKRKEFNCTIHTHSTYVIALSMAGATVIPANLQITAVGLEPIAVYNKMLYIDTPLRGEEVAALLGPNKAVILKGHGAVIVGESIEDAMYAALILERAAMFQLIARSIGPLKPISKEEKTALTTYHNSLQRGGHGSFREWAYYEWKLNPARVKSR
jgi:ribulose-5-phosphate 4-epimerase/fuculose-1-phosphate aldolase